MKYLIYCRKSTDTEDRQVQSLDSQERELLEMAKKYNLDVTEILSESMSAKSEGRPVFNKMLKMIENGKADAIICWKLDRLARNMIDGGKVMDLLGKGIIKEIRTFESTHLPNDNVLMLAVNFGNANQFIRDLSANVKRGNREKLARGEWPNHAPFGYLNDKAEKKIIVEPMRSKYVVRAFDLYLTGGYSYKQISDILYTEGLRTSSGQKVLRGRIHKIISNPFYMGMMLRDGKYFKGNHQSLISKETFEKAQNFVGDRSRPRSSTLFFPLRGFLKCDNCGCVLTASLKRGHHYYYCTNGKQICHEHKSYIRENDLYEKVSELFKNLYFSPAKIDLMYKASLERLNSEKDYSEKVLETLQTALESLKTREEKLVDTFLAEQIPKDLYDRKILEIHNEIISLTKQIEDTKTKQPAFTLEQIKNVFLQGYISQKAFLDGDDVKKRNVMESLLWNISVKEKNIVSYQFKSPYDVLAKAPKNASFSQMLGDRDSNPN